MDRVVALPPTEVNGIKKLIAIYRDASLPPSIRDQAHNLVLPILEAGRDVARALSPDATGEDLLAYFPAVERLSP